MKTTEMLGTYPAEINLDRELLTRVVDALAVHPGPADVMCTIKARERVLCR